MLSDFFQQCNLPLERKAEVVNPFTTNYKLSFQFCGEDWSNNKGNT